MRSSVIAPYAPVVLKLLQGPLYSDDTGSWNLLLTHRDQVRLYCAQIGLDLQVHEEDGFAYLHQPVIEDDEGRIIDLPRLTRRTRLSYHVTWLCILLREYLLQFESNNFDNSACLITREQIHELLLPFMPERTNELVVRKKIDSTIEPVIDLGFLRKMPSLGPNHFEVRRLLKAKINAEKLAEIKERLKSYDATYE